MREVTKKTFTGKVFHRRGYKKTDNWFMVLSGLKVIKIKEHEVFICRNRINIM
jgi:hypothetical protein